MRELGLLAAIGLFAASSAVADNWDRSPAVNDSSAATTNELVHGSVQVHDLDDTNSGLATDEDWYRLGYKPFSSYEIVVDATTPYINASANILLELVDSSGGGADPSVPVSSLGFARAYRGANPSAIEQSPAYFRVMGATCGVGCDFRDTYQISVWDTTYRIARFNNSASQVSLVILQNPNDEPADVIVMYFDTAGNLLNQEPGIQIPAGGAHVWNTSATVPAASGSILVLNGAPYGTLAGKGVAVEPATGFTFDTPMVPRAK